MEVPKGTCLRDLRSDHKRSQQQLQFNNPQAWKVTGSTGSLYIVERNMLGSYGCTCLGFNFRKKCSHIDKIKANETN